MKTPLEIAAELRRAVSDAHCTHGDSPLPVWTCGQCWDAAVATAIREARAEAYDDARSWLHCLKTSPEMLTYRLEELAKEARNG